MPSKPIVAAVVTVALLIGVAGCSPNVSARPGLLAGGSSPEVGVEDGYLATGETVYLADDVPAITNLDEALRIALAEAQTAAAAREVEFTFTAGWRSERYQELLFEQAVSDYGSEQEASKWVLTPDRSQHVLGRAVDVATADAMDWLNRFGAEFGLCQTYANESWHFEYIEGIDGSCPPQLPDSSASGTVAG
jgi:hypothetical protein